MKKSNLFVLHATDKEKAAIEDLSKKKALTPQQVLRQALRLYQAVEAGAILITPAEPPVGCGDVGD